MLDLIEKNYLSAGHLLDPVAEPAASALPQACSIPWHGLRLVGDQKSRGGTGALVVSKLLNIPEKKVHRVRIWRAAKSHTLADHVGSIRPVWDMAWCLVLFHRRIFSSSNFMISVSFLREREGSPMAISCCSGWNLCICSSYGSYVVFHLFENL